MYERGLIYHDHQRLLKQPFSIVSITAECTTVSEKPGGRLLVELRPHYQLVRLRHDVGETLRAKAQERGATRTFVLGLAQDHLMYIASRREYRRGGYESISTLFGETTADQVVDAQRELLEAIGFAKQQ